MANGKKKIVAENDTVIMIEGYQGAKLTNIFILACSYKMIFLTQW